MLNANLFEAGFDIVPLFIGQDANTDVSGDYLKVAHCNGPIYLLLIKGGSEDVDDLGLEIFQATDNAGTGEKALNASRYWYKTGTLTSIGQWTAGELATADNFLGFGSSLPTGATRVVDDIDTNQLMLLVEIRPQSMDVSGGFDFIHATVEGDNVNNACLLSCYAIFTNNAYPQAIPLSVLA